MDGLLIIDKPSGPTSHDVVARMRRVLRERRVGHTGTLDPMATGVLPLVLGRATRLAKFMSAGDKVYEAVVRLGLATDTGDAHGAPAGIAWTGPWPARDVIDAALDAFRGTFLQQPPAFSAKRVEGKRSYTLARNARLTGLAEASRRRKPRATDPLPDPPALPAPPAPLALPAPIRVTVHRLEIADVEADRVTLHLDCSAGFYVRSLAHDLGARLGVGAHLVALRRTRSGDFGLDVAIALDTAERNPRLAIDRVIAPAQMLPRLSPVVLTADGVRRARYGRDLGPADVEKGDVSVPFFCRLLDPAGELVGIGEPSAASGLLHPSVVLG